ncbi:hypothetical protein GCM10010176_058710 [Nonomuraea spiralis]|nr:hypothetical protein GCM10010176_058710 [Nonomuraea spiralis]
MPHPRQAGAGDVEHQGRAGRGKDDGGHVTLLMSVHHTEYHVKRDVTGHVAVVDHRGARVPAGPAAPVGTAFPAPRDLLPPAPAAHPAGRSPPGGLLREAGQEGMYTPLRKQTVALRDASWHPDPPAEGGSP